ncbi:hypothetical protein BGZ95_003403 [Linnemannia exigua]|uniref:Vacuolar ATPase assembly protein VMA22 n=1 Tax=Linnemannia exigua TaxID=604196 RepID=A0AAD4D483_9FUNG|nr:hypothetical protein BGZ95_003403 [Linnemannia exigua]
MPDITAVHQAHNKVCQDLDDLVLEYISLVNEHLTAWTRISSRFQEGRELISQAKYIMGPKNVSADCYDHRMKALRGVMIKSSTKEIEIRDLRAEEIERQRVEKAREEEEAAAGGTGKDEEGNHRRQKSGTGYDDQDQGSIRAGLRRRGGGGGGVASGGGEVSDDLEGKDDKSDKRHESPTKNASSIGSTATGSTTTTGTSGDATKKKKERNPDPLLWFGVFVPASLRSAQSIFQQGLQDLVEMAMIRQRLIELEEKMTTLREAKAAAAAAASVSVAGTKPLELEADLKAMKV